VATGAISNTGANSHRWLLATVLLYTSFIPATFLWAPALASELTNTLGLAPTRIGSMFLVEMVFISLSTLFAFFWLNSAHLQRWGLVFIFGYIIGNFIAGWLVKRDFNGFIIARGVTSFAAGSLLILCTHSMRRLPDRGRGFGAMIFAHLMFGAAGIAVLPIAFKYFGTGVFFNIQSLLMLACMPLYRHLAYQRDDKEAQVRHTFVSGLKQYSTSFTGHGLLSVISILLLYTCLGGIWTFLGSLQAPTGMSRELLDQIFTVSSVVGIVGAGLATIFGAKEQHRKLCLLFGYAALILSLVVMAVIPRIWAVYTAVIIFKLTWTLLAPFMYTVVSLHDDHRGGLINLTNLVLGIGVGSSPAICGWLLESFNYKVMFGFGALLALCAAVAINVANFGLKKNSALSVQGALA